MKVGGGGGEKRKPLFFFEDYCFSQKGAVFRRSFLSDGDFGKLSFPGSLSDELGDLVINGTSLALGFI